MNIILFYHTLKQAGTIQAPPSRLSMDQAEGPWPMGGPGPDLKGQGPGHQVAGLALFGRVKGWLMFELALGLNPD